MFSPDTGPDPETVELITLAMSFWVLANLVLGQWWGTIVILMLFTYLATKALDDESEP